MVVGQLLITPTVEVCIQQLGIWFNYDMMRYGIYRMRWASASRGSVSGSGDSCLIIQYNAMHIYCVFTGCGCTKHSSSLALLLSFWDRAADRTCKTLVYIEVHFTMSSTLKTTFETIHRWNVNVFYCPVFIHTNRLTVYCKSSVGV